MAKSRKMPADFDGGFYFEAAPGWLVAIGLVLAAGLYVAYRVGVGG